MPKRPKSPPPFPSREAVTAYVREAQGRTSRRDIARAFNLTADQRPQLRALLKEMEADGAVERGRGRSVLAKGALPPVTVVEITGVDEDGDVIGRPLLARDDPDPPVIVMAPERRGQPALGPGDRVLARLANRGADRYEGRTIRRVGAAPASVIGIFEVERGEARIHPIVKGARHDLAVATGESAGAQPGDLVRVETLPGRKLGLRKARVVERLHSGARSFSVIALHEHEIPIDFDAEALAQAKAAGPARLDAREDLRSVPLVTIDGADARDFDDAVWAEPDADPANPGGWRILVAIADVAWYVRQNDALDRAARERGNSVYFPDRVVPMLPEALSNGWCSLNPGEDRPCLAARMTIDAQGKLKSHRFVRGLMRSAARLTYSQVQEARDGKPDSKTQPLIGTVIEPLYGAYAALARDREARGTLELDLPERRVTLGADGTVESVALAPRYDSHRLIEEFMIAANVAAAEMLSRSRVPCMYRVHDVPSEEKMASLREVLADMGLKLPRGQAVRPAHFNRVLAQVRGKPEESLVGQMVLRSQAQAEYSPANIGHFGLALRKYCHFTSPIRRYSDLLVHRALIRCGGLGEGALPDDAPDFANLGEHISMTERRAAAAERDTVDRYVAQYLAEREGTVFAGTVTGAGRFGLFVRLDEVGADGLVPRRHLPRDTYIHDEKRQSLTGRREGHGWRIGDRVEVMLAEATPATGGLILHLLDGGPPKRAKGRRKKR